jgi:hypothetical protein
VFICSFFPFHKISAIADQSCVLMTSFPFVVGARVLSREDIPWILLGAASDCGGLAF